MDTVESTSSDVYGLHDKIDRKKKVEQHNEETQISFQNRFQTEVSSMQDKLTEFVSLQKTSYNSLMDQSSKLILSGVLMRILPFISNDLQLNSGIHT